MKLSQNKINLEMDAVRLLRVMIVIESEARRRAENKWEIEGVCWTDRLLSQFVDLPVDRIRSAVEWLIRREFITCGNNTYLVEDEGQQYYSGLLRQSKFLNDLDFREEVLSGMDKNGRRTRIDNAVLPGSETPPINKNDPEKIFSRLELNRKIKQAEATKLGIDIAEFDRRLQDGSIHLCRGYRREQHIGIFDRNGKSWRSLCRICRKAKRKGGEVK